MSEKTKEVRPQTIHCNNCKDWLRLEYKSINEIIDEVCIVLSDMPILVCPNCKEEYKPDCVKTFIQILVKGVKKQNKRLFEVDMKERRQLRYDICEEFKFKYDANDWKCIPGLSGQLSKEGFFTPVFFDKKVLDKYLNFDEYGVQDTGNTYGTIFFKDKGDLSYGINRNGKLFCWLGDIEENVPEDECHYLRSKNIESDHDVGSEFYAAQIEAKFTELSNESVLLEQRSAFEDACKHKDKFKIFNYEDDEYELLGEIIRPVNWNKKGVIHIINSLTRLCIESIDNKNLKNQIKSIDSSIDLGTKRSLKLLEIWIKIKFKSLDAQDIMKPFFALYDFRLVLNHKMSKNKIKEIHESCYKRLGITTNQNFETLYDKLIEEMAKSFEKLTKSFD